MQARHTPFPQEVGRNYSNEGAYCHIRKVMDIEIDARPTDRDGDQQQPPTVPSSGKYRDTEESKCCTGMPGRERMVFILEQQKFVVPPQAIPFLVRFCVVGPRSSGDEADRVNDGPCNC